MKKIIKESKMSRANFAKYAETAELLFTAEQFIRNWKNIVKDFGYVGQCIIYDWSVNNKLYGLMFKDQGGDEQGNAQLKCHIYSFPQTGIIKGGTTFFVSMSDEFDFSKAFDEAVAKVR